MCNNSIRNSFHISIFILHFYLHFYIYLVMLPLLLLSVDSFYYFVLPWMSIGLEKLASCRAPEEDVTTRTESRPGGKE